MRHFFTLAGAALMTVGLSGCGGGGIDEGIEPNVDLSKTAMQKVASMANCGGARAIRPYHTTGDGDQLIAVSTRKLQRPNLQLTVIGALAADVVAEAIVRGVRAAKSVPEWPGLAAG